MQDNEDEGNVYGRTYEEAAGAIALIEQALEQHAGIGFSGKEECEEFAKENHLDVVALSKSSKCFWYLTHLGELVKIETWFDAYRNVMYYMDIEGDKAKVRRWKPENYMTMRNARCIGEQGDGIREALYYRDYFLPKGFYNEVLGKFNAAKPFPCFARATGRDTSHIHTLLKHIGGECYMWLLSWLRHKMIWPKVKTQVIPIFVSKAQGSGKSTFAECICRGLFGEDNVVISYQFDSMSRFNSDHADALIVCIEEKEEKDKRNTSSALKNSATASKIRKEQKGVDPIYQDSYTDYVMTTNGDVPIKFDDRSTQRRMMVMEADGNFTRETSALADEVFTKLYGVDGSEAKVGKPFYEDNDLISQFKHELWSSEEIKNVNLRQFPKTEAYDRCFSLPRTNDVIEIETLIKSLAPFIRASLNNKTIAFEIENDGEVSSLTDVLPVMEAIMFVQRSLKGAGNTDRVGLNRMITFVDPTTNRQYAHSTVERTMNDCKAWLKDTYNIAVLPTSAPPNIGFKGVHSRYKMSPTFWFTEYVPPVSLNPVEITVPKTPIIQRIGERVRFNKHWAPDDNGEYETINEMLPGTLSRLTENAAYMDTFLLEGDTPTYAQKAMEKKRIKIGATMQAEDFFKERLAMQRKAAEDMFNNGIAARIVYSGFKSYHVAIRVNPAPASLDEYKWLHGHLCNTLGHNIIYDPVCKDVLRLTRAPASIERVTEYAGMTIKGEQRLIQEDWTHVYNLVWKPMYQRWLSRPLSRLESITGNKLIPIRQEYHDAALALCEGTFWTDNRWDGRRQEVFFVAYRVLRMLGFSRDTLWTDTGILDGINGYYKSNEIEYWKGRKDSSLILEIDRDFEEGK